MSASVSLISLNIERAKHLDLVLPFLEKEKPDVACIQELLEQDIVRFEEVLGYRGVYAPMSHVTENGVTSVFGLAIFSRLPITKVFEEYYFGNRDNIPHLVKKELEPATEDINEKMNRLFASCEIEKDGEIFKIGTTHFTWTPDGSTSDRQRRDLEKLLKIVNSSGEIVFCGDFNAPRGGEIFNTIASRYKDNIPTEYSTSLDGKLHRAAPIDRMVDVMFSTPGYKVSDVSIVCGISDHCAVKAKIEIIK